jgi:hypothetical protein
MLMQPVANEHLRVRDDKHLYEDLFSKWRPWLGRKELDNLKFPGVYALAHTDASVDTPFSWRGDIIYVGMTTAATGLKSRLKQFDDTIVGKRATHGGADRVRYKYPDYKSLCKSLYVAVVPFCRDHVTSYTPYDLRQMGEVVRFECQCFAHFVELFKMMPEFNDHKRSPNKYSLTIGKKRLGKTVDGGTVDES